MKHSNYTQNFEVDGPYQDTSPSLVDCIMIFFAGVTLGLLVAIFSMGY